MEDHRRSSRNHARITGDGQARGQGGNAPRLARGALRGRLALAPLLEGYKRRPYQRHNIPRAARIPLLIASGAIR